MNSYIKRQSGFTVIELLVVILVIGILVTITIVAYVGVTNHAIVSSMQNDLTNAAQVLKLDRATNGNYPTTLAAADNGNGVKASTGTTYQYSVDNTAYPKTFCITATNGKNAYKIDQSNSPIQGACSGHTLP
jgi:prepilin-type N-terminal cleavage/methylation domain-containing protein